MIAGGLIAVALGAVLTLAVGDSIDGVDLSMIGMILMGIGLLSVVVGLVTRGSGSKRIQTSKQVSDDGNTVVEERRID